jgi:hypothetical protein
VRGTKCEGGRLGRVALTGESVGDDRNNAPYKTGGKAKCAQGRPNELVPCSWGGPHDSQVRTPVHHQFFGQKSGDLEVYG